MTVTRPATYEALVSAIAQSLASSTGATMGASERAAMLAESAGLEALLADLALAERILRAGEGFHSIERFFVDGSEEQRYLARLRERS